MPHPLESIYVQYEGMVYQQMVGISMGTNCAPIIADSFLFCHERVLMYNLYKSKQMTLYLMKLLLSSWQIYTYAILWHGIQTNSLDSYGHLLCSAYNRLISILLREGFYVKPPEIETD